MNFTRTIENYYIYILFDIYNVSQQSFMLIKILILIRKVVTPQRAGEPKGNNTRLYNYAVHLQ